MTYGNTKCRLGMIVWLCTHVSSVVLFGFFWLMADQGVYTL